MGKVKPEKHALPEAIATADRLHSAAIHLLRRVRKRDAASGIGPTQLSALSVLVFGGAKTLGELATAEQVKPPTMSRVVAALLRSRLIEIASDPVDARCMRICATTKGAALLQRARQWRTEYLASQVEKLATSELAELTRGIAILEKVLTSWQ